MTRQRLERTFTAALIRSDDGDGRTLSGRVVPYGEVATVADDDGVPYRESFALGSFRRATKAADARRVLLRFEHGTGLTDVCGHAASLTERPDGLHGVFRVHPTPAGDTALALLDAEVVTGFSVGCVVFGPNRRGPSGEVMRTACHLDEVSLCRQPAYAGAVGVTARSSPEADWLADFRPPTAPELDERLRRLGLGVKTVNGTGTP